MEKNYNLLKQKNPLLHEIIKTFKPSNDYEIELSKDGRNIIRAEDNTGKRFYLNSKYDVNKDVEQFAKSVDLNAGLYLQIGLGSLHEVNFLLKRKQQSAKIVIIEPNIQLVKKLLDDVDLSSLLKSPDIYLFSGTFEEIQRQYVMFANYLYIYSSAKLELVKLSYIDRLNESDLIKKIVQEFKGTIVSQSMRIGNSVEDTLLGINHFFSNILEGLQSPQIKQAAEYYRGRPAICVASGPSLDKNISQLKEVQDKALIFCADSAYEKLIKQGIIADATSVMERPKIIYNLFFKDKQDLYHENTCLLSQIVAYPKIFQEYKGPKIVCSKEQLPFEKNASDEIPTLNNFYNGLSCAHLSVATAILLGCNPIIMVGQDLAYSETGVSHAKGTHMENNTASDNKNGNHLEVLSYDQKNKILTTSVWDTFRRWFEEVFYVHNDITFINATEGGAHIAGAKHITLQKALQKYVVNSDSLPTLKDIMEETKNTIDVNKVKEKAINYFNDELYQVRTLLDELKQIDKNFVSMYAKYRKLARKQDIMNQKDFNKLISCVNRLEQCYTSNKNISFITQAMQARFRQLVHQQSHLETHEDFLLLLKNCKKKAVELLQSIKKIEFEYIRGLSILQNDKVETIDTPLMGEMYQE